jgi:nitrate reductase NapAB chaperone NapD
MSQDIHIVSVIIYANPEYLDDVLSKANKLPQAECHSNQGDHKFVLVFEAESDFELSSTIDEINSWKGVLSTQLCYHHCEPTESLQEEIQYATHTS